MPTARLTCLRVREVEERDWYLEERRRARLDGDVRSELLGCNYSSAFIAPVRARVVPNKSVPWCWGASCARDEPSGHVTSSEVPKVTLPA